MEVRGAYCPSNSSCLPGASSTVPDRNVVSLNCRGIDIEDSFNQLKLTLDWDKIVVFYVECLYEMGRCSSKKCVNICVEVSIILQLFNLSFLNRYCCCLCLYLYYMKSFLTFLVWLCNSSNVVKFRFKSMVLKKIHWL